MLSLNLVRKDTIMPIKNIFHKKKSITLYLLFIFFILLCLTGIGLYFSKYSWNTPISHPNTINQNTTSLSLDTTLHDTSVSATSNESSAISTVNSSTTVNYSKDNGTTVMTNSMTPTKMNSMIVKDTEVRELTAFTQISVDIPVTLHITTGPKSQIQLSGDSTVLSQIKSDVYADTLHLSADTLHLSADSFKSTIPTVITIQSPTLTYLETQAPVNGNLIVNQSFFELNLSNGSQITLSGHTDKLKLTLANASTIQQHNFNTQQAIVDIANASHASLTVTQHIMGNVSNASHLTLSDKVPSQDIKTSTASTISFQ